MLIQVIGITKYANNTNEIKFVFFYFTIRITSGFKFVIPFNLVLAANLGVMFLKSV